MTHRTIVVTDIVSGQIYIWYIGKNWFLPIQGPKTSIRGFTSNSGNFTS
jgi:hypothetical protein